MATGGDPVRATRRMLVTGVLPAAFFAVFGIRAVVSDDWTTAAMFAGFFVIYAVMITWRLRSGIPTWSFLATIVGLVTRIRPTRSGLVRKCASEHFPYRERQMKESFESLAGRLHSEVGGQRRGSEADSSQSNDAESDRR